MCRRVALTLLPIAPQLTNEGTDLLLFNVNSGCSEPARFPQSTHSEETLLYPQAKQTVPCVEKIFIKYGLHHSYL